MIEKSMTEKISERQITLKESLLFIARTVMISNCILSFTSRINSRARQFSDELKKVRQRSYLKRMTKMIQSKLSIIDEILRSEHYDDISEHAMQFITSFIFINFRTQKNSFIAKNLFRTRHQVTSQIFSVVDFFAVISNIVFDLKKFLFELEIIFERDEIEKEVSIDEIRVDLQSTRIVLIFFNENEAIMRRIIEYDNEKQKLNIKNETYRIYREISLKIRDIIYRQEWEQLIKENEDRRVYEMMINKEWTQEWDYRFYNHMKKSRHIRITLSIAIKRRMLFEESDDQYLEYRIYKRNQISAVEAKKTMKKAIEEIESLTKQIKNRLRRVQLMKKNERLDVMNNFAKNLTRLSNAVTIIMNKFVEEMNDWKY